MSLECPLDIPLEVQHQSENSRQYEDNHDYAENPKRHWGRSSCSGNGSGKPCAKTYERNQLRRGIEMLEEEQFGDEADNSQQYNREDHLAERITAHVHLSFAVRVWGLSGPSRYATATELRSITSSHFEWNITSTRSGEGERTLSTLSPIREHIASRAPASG